MAHLSVIVLPVCEDIDYCPDVDKCGFHVDDEFLRSFLDIVQKVGEKVSEDEWVLHLDHGDLFIRKMHDNDVLVEYWTENIEERCEDVRELIERLVKYPHLLEPQLP